MASRHPPATGQSGRRLARARTPSRRHSRATSSRASSASMDLRASLRCPSTPMICTLPSVPDPQCRIIVITSPGPGLSPPRTPQPEREGETPQPARPGPLSLTLPRIIYAQAKPVPAGVQNLGGAQFYPRTWEAAMGTAEDSEENDEALQIMWPPKQEPPSGTRDHRTQESVRSLRPHARRAPSVVLCPRAVPLWSTHPPPFAVAKMRVGGDSAGWLCRSVPRSRRWLTRAVGQTGPHQTAIQTAMQTRRQTARRKSQRK